MPLRIRATHKTAETSETSEIPAVRTRLDRRTRPLLRGRLVAAATGFAVALGLGAVGTTASQAADAPSTAASTAASATGASAQDLTDGPEGPPQKSFLDATAYALLHPTAVPAGANDWDCEPSAEHPNPVVLVHGTFENRYMNWAGLSPRLKDAGYCVYALNYGGTQGGLLQGTGDIADSAAQLSAFVDTVRDRSGAAEVDLVGHSQGGMMPRHYLKNLGGADKVGKLIALTPPNHGTSLSGLATLATFIPGAEKLTGLACPACQQQRYDSDFVASLNEGGEVVPGVDYTVLATWTDWVVTPYTSSYLTPGDRVSQSKLQDHCPFNLTSHVGISYDRTATRIVLNALDPENAQKPRC
ncbi:esterase/lipase family protein [Streptomyces apocyni]|uniref:esterase/lipase family protein n=1 Tax=Streptomyces apocyni TaxID=2654677 RepID=UPI0012E9A660|nr:alpha/beta fold hydrolase [Streptomyces apocyni]